MIEHNEGEFQLDEAFSRLAVRICRDIKSERRRERGISELRAHFEDVVEDIMRRGIPSEKAYAMLEESLGDIDKLTALMASVHNTPCFPSFFLWLMGGVLFIGGLGSYFVVENRVLKAWLGLGLQIAAIVAIIAAMQIAGNYIRAIWKRILAIRRLRKWVEARGGKLTQLENAYKSIFVRTDTPEFALDIGNYRYILAFWSTVQRRCTLHLQDNGIYSYNKHFGYMVSAFSLNSAIGLLRTRGMVGDPLYRAYHYEMIKLPKGIHLMPEIRYKSFFAYDKANIPVFLLNPIPLNIEICENGHIHKLSNGDILPEALGNAKIYSMSSFIATLEREFNS